MTEKTTEEILHSSSDEFGTPQWLFDELNAVHHFTLDVCASEKNHKCERYNSILEPHKFPWRGESCFMNPPYSGFTTTYGAPLKMGWFFAPYGVDSSMRAGYRVPDSRRLLWSGAVGLPNLSSHSHKSRYFRAKPTK